MGSYVDTTVVVEAAKQTAAWTQHFEPHLIGKPPAQVPHYAFREFSAGALRTIATAHNQLSQATNPAEALQQILRLPSFVGRTKDGQLKAFAQVLGPALNQSGSPGQAMFIGVRRSMCQSLAVMAEREWRRAKSEPTLAKIQELACFGTGELDIQGGLLVGPEAGRWECDQKTRCSAAEYLYDKPQELQKVIAYLRADTSMKPETVRRRKALKELVEVGPQKFNKGLCRALGDAYFAIMCPAGSDVVTTNLVDHVPLAASVGKSAINPAKP